MEMANDINKIIQRTRRYWYADGLPETAVGCLFLLVGILLFLGNVGFLPQDSPLRASLLSTILVGISMIALVAFAGLGVAYVLNAAKMRVTFPRSGFVAYRHDDEESRRFTTVLLVICILVIFLVVIALPALNSLSTLEGLLFGALLVYQGYKLALTRFYVLAGISVIVGPGAALAGLGDAVGSAVYFGVMGVAVGVSGILTLRYYLSQVQLLVEE